MVVRSSAFGRGRALPGWLLLAAAAGRRAGRLLAEGRVCWPLELLDRTLLWLVDTDELWSRIVNPSDPE
jgi:hypothetical protein